MLRTKIYFLLVTFYTYILSGQTIRPMSNWKYVPIDEKLYQKMNVDSSDPVDDIEVLFDIQDKNKSSLTGAEAQALLGKRCLKLKLYYCSYFYSLKVINNFPGSMPSYLALENLNTLLAVVNYNDLDLEIILSKGGFVEVPGSLMGMINYYLLRHNLKLGFKNWAIANKKTLQSGDDFWLQKYQFLKAIDLVRLKRPAEAKRLMLEILKKTAAYPDLDARVNHQIARLNFELKDFDGADKIYSKLVSNPREYGRAMIERAWIRYLKKDYAVALGMMHSLKMPSLAQSQHPDQYKLQMLILRDLCYFSEVKKVAAEFHKKYEGAFSIIESGKELITSVELLNLVFQKAQWLPWAELITQIRAEKDQVKSILGHIKNLTGSLIPQYDFAEGQLKEQLKMLLKAPLEEVAEELLETREQINLLEYLADLDKIRPKTLGKNVRAEQIDKFAIKKIYWPQTTEYWRSEVNNIKVLISDRCQGG